MMNKILITGGTGFIGKHLCDVLTQVNIDYTIVTRNPKEINHIGWNELLKLNEKKIETVSSIIHLATFYGRNNEDSNEIKVANYYYPKKLLEQFPKANFINLDTFFNKFHTYRHLHSYSQAKRDFRSFAENSTNNKFVTLSLEHVYGKNDSMGKFIPWVITNLKNGQPIELTDCLHKRDFVYVSDVVNCIIYTIQNFNKLQTNYYEIGTGDAITIKSFLDKISEALEIDHRLLRYGTKPKMIDEIQSSRASDSGFWQESVGKFHSIDSGIKKLLGKNENTYT